jgi:hypothetical protein
MGSVDNIQVRQHEMSVLKHYWRVFVILVVGECILHWASPLPYRLQANASEIAITDSLLRELLPKIKNPRLLTVNDLRDDDERSDFQRSESAFVVKGDFNKDGQRDYAIAGKYDSEDNEDANFILIVTILRGKPTVSYFHRLYIDRFGLGLVKNCRKKFNGIVLVFTFMSDHVQFIVWDGKKYTPIKMCD